MGLAVRYTTRTYKLQNSTKGFALVKVKGRKRVPKPPTRIKAFMFTEYAKESSVSPFL